MAVTSILLDWRLVSAFMTRRVAPVRERIRKVLAAARTSEPYPVWITWETLAVKVYGYGHRTKNDIQNIRRAAEQMHDVEMLRYRGTNKHCGPRLRATPEEGWLRRYVIDVYSETMNGADYSAYQPPSVDHILEAFRNGCHQEGRIRIDLARAVALVNKSCGTVIDSSDLAWWRVGLEERRRHERQELLGRLHRAFVGLSVEKEQSEREARQIDFGRVRVDPLTVKECPCCLRGVDPGFFPVQRLNTSAEPVLDGQSGLSV